MSHNLWYNYRGQVKGNVLYQKPSDTNWTLWVLITDKRNGAEGTVHLLCPPVAPGTSSARVGGVVELRGFEPLTPCVQSRCSPTELQPHTSDV